MKFFDGRQNLTAANPKRRLSNHTGDDDRPPRSSGYMMLSEEIPEEDRVQDEATVPQGGVPTAPYVAAEDMPKVAASKAIAILQQMEGDGYCSIEADSVYGAAVAMPQIARSAGWPATLTTLVIRIYFFTLLNFLVQGFLLSMIGEEQLIMYPFAGQMHLCDFGASVKACPDAANCVGPSGTVYTPARLYSFPIWSTRVFVRDSMKAVFPEYAEKIDEHVDPGEYGLENYTCRLACIFIFMLAVVEDLNDTFQLARTLWKVPTCADSWVSYSVPKWASKEDVKRVKGWTELDLVKFKVAGIPIHWKVLNFFFILLPKFALWLALSKSGVHYLMETAGIVDLIVNSLALAFVLDVDEMVFHRFSSTLTKHIISNIEDLPNFDTEPTEKETDAQALQRYISEELGWNRCRKLLLCVPIRFLCVLLLQAVFMWDYYRENCQLLPDGSYVSNDLKLPQDLVYRPLALMFGLLPESTSDPVWSMPNISSADGSG